MLTQALLAGVELGLNRVLQMDSTALPRLARLEGKLAECDAAMADPAVYADAGKVADLGRMQLQLRQELETAEAELLALYEG